MQRRTAGDFRPQVHFAEDDADADEDDAEPQDETLFDVLILPGFNSLPDFDISGSSYEGDDHLRLRSWLEELPRGRSRSERSLLEVQDVSLVQGGRVCVIRGNGSAEMGSAALDLDGFDTDWEDDLRRLQRSFEGRLNWSGVRLWELLPEGCQAFLGRMPIAVTPETQTRLVPRTIWTNPVLRRTSVARCVGCLCVDLEAREVYNRQRLRWIRGSMAGTLQSWRHRTERIHHFGFRRHSCGLGIYPNETWRGVFSQTERGCRGGNVGWEITFRAFIYAAIPSGFPHSVYPWSVRY